MRSRRLVTLVVAIIAVVALAWALTPYVRAASLLVRAANFGGQVEAFARARTRGHGTADAMVPTREGDVPARFYEPAGNVRRTCSSCPGTAARASTTRKVEQVLR